MKKVILSILAISAFSAGASAQQKAKGHKHCPAASCTDHRYDHAYNAGNTPNMEWAENPSKKSCPAARCTDHSFDEAYNVSNGAPASSDQAMQSEVVANQRTWTPVTTRTRDDAYSMNDFTFYGRYNKAGNGAPNPYSGDDAPSYDGAAKNAYRNIRANNDSEPLPANNGQ